MFKIKHVLLSVQGQSPIVDLATAVYTLVLE